nr:phospholipase D-like domain-containing protein [Stakelama sediminis]
MLTPGRNCWRIERADAASVIVDAEDYFRLARAAMRTAKHQILLIGWDFDARIKLVDDDTDDAPTHIGNYIDWLVRRTPELQIYLLRWDMGALKALFRGRNLVTLLRWWRHRRIHLKLDRFHPAGASHHQKIVVIDDCIAFCGGIDMTVDRWDTRGHLDDDPRRTEPNGAPYAPWHDATTALSGPVAAALGELCRDRWHRAGGRHIAAPPETAACWPDGLDRQFTDCSIAISRTYPAMTDQPPVHEIEQLYLDAIERAERWIYAESQYFASRRIAEAIARRLQEENGPEIVILNPVVADGWLEQEAMDSARAQLLKTLQKLDTHNRLRVYHAETAGGTPIYIHAKVTIIDGRVLRVGSSNFNNRSMRLDTECDVTIDAEHPGNGPCANRIEAIAHDLIAEHLGCEAALVAERFAATGSLIRTIESLRSTGRRMRPYRFPELNEAEQWLADNEVLDPENPQDMFEPMHNPGLLHRLRVRLRLASRKTRR